MKRFIDYHYYLHSRSLNKSEETKARVFLISELFHGINENTKQLNFVYHSESFLKYLLAFRVRPTVELHLCWRLVADNTHVNQIVSV